MPLVHGIASAAYPSGVSQALFYRAVLVVAVMTVLALMVARGWLREAGSAPPPDASTPHRSTLTYSIVRGGRSTGSFRPSPRWSHGP